MKNHLFFGLILSMFVFASCDQNDKRSNRKGKSEQVEVDTTSVTERIRRRLKEVNEEIIANPNDPSLYYKRAALYLEVKNAQRAVEDMLRVIKLDSTNADYRVDLGEMYFVNKRPDLAREQFEKAVELDDKNTDAILKLAEIELILHQYDAMFSLVNRALRIDETLERGYFMKGIAYSETGDSAMAVSSFETARELKSDNYAANMEIGKLFASAKNESAFDYYDAALSINPNSTEAFYHKGKFAQDMIGEEITEQDLKKLDIAITCYENMIKIDSTNSLAYYNLGYIQLVYGGKEKDLLEAVSNFNRALTYTPEYVEAYYNRGYAYELLGDKAKAGRDYRVTLDLNPQFDLAAEGLSRLGN